MAKFTCQNDDCKKAQRKEDEDIRLHLIVEEGLRTIYRINDNGELEHYDSDGTGQDIKIECPVCCLEYELHEGYGYFEIKETHSLPFTKQELREMKLTKKV